MPENHSFSFLKCLNCSAQGFTEDSQRQSICCNRCGHIYPLISFGHAKIPFVFSHIDVAIQDWASRLNGFKQKTQNEINKLENTLKDKSISKITRKRLKVISKAKKTYQQQIADHLADLTRYFPEQQFNTQAAVAKNQGIDSYVNNIFRDWSWENGENEELLNAVESVINTSEFKPGLTLTLGAGAARFSFDFHNRYQPNHSILLDINPVLIGMAARILNDDDYSLYEFPVAPQDLESFAINKVCKIPDAVASTHKIENFSYLMSDALNAPLGDKAVNTVLTPWLIDILPVDFREFIPHVNRLLPVGGHWINTGSLAFFHNQEDWNYSEEEIVDLLKKYGFEEIRTSRASINYLHSPHSAHGRIETIFSFSAKKKFDCLPVKKYEYLPEWITDIYKNIPAQTTTPILSSKYLLQSQVLSAINGNLSIADIGRLLAHQYQMPEQSACAAVRQILIDNYKDIKD